jgi:plasmid stabilization system protein ParE
MAGWRLSFTADALAEVAAIARWWRRNRPAAPRLFDHELDTALVAIETRPEIGPLARLRGHPSGRFYLLERTGYVVFYLADVPRDEITVVRVRHARRRPLARARRR